MNPVKLRLAICLSVLSWASHAQENKHAIDAPVDIKQTGWNKVLCLKNGNTMLFHFDRNMPVVAKVFDSLHKETASVSYLPKLLDVATFKTVHFQGLFEINGESVLFFEQERLSKHELVRLRFSGDNGTVLEEKQVGESKSIGKKTEFAVIKNKADDEYAILYSVDDPNFKKCDLHVTYFNNKHESYKDIPLDVDRKKYDYLFVVGAEAQPNGICVTLDLETLAQNGAPSRTSNVQAVYDHDEAMYYISKKSGVVKQTVVKMSTDIYPSYTKYSYNPFANALNLLLFSYCDIRYKFGISLKRGEAIENLLFVSDLNTGSTKLNQVNNKFVTNAMRKKDDTSALFYGMPLTMVTNENGLSTVVSEAYERYDEPETRTRYNLYTNLGNIGITQLDDDGNELWGAVLPHAECFKSYKRFLAPSEFAMKRNEAFPFYDLPEQVYQRQFLSLNSYAVNKDLYIVYNDYNKNFNSPADKPSDTIYDFTTTNACYYKINSKREITRHYLFGEPVANEYKSSFIEGADFDEKRGTYATLVQYKHEDDISLHMAWVRLD